MKMIRLNPSIPLDTPKGPGLAILATWLSEEEHIIWTVIQDETGEIWNWANPKVRGQKNIQMQRIVDNSHLRGDVKSKINESNTWNDAVCKKCLGWEKECVCDDGFTPSLSKVTECDALFKQAKPFPKDLVDRSKKLTKGVAPDCNDDYDQDAIIRWFESPEEDDFDNEGNK